MDMSSLSSISEVDTKLKGFEKTFKHLNDGAHLTHNIHALCFRAISSSKILPVGQILPRL